MGARVDVVIPCYNYARYLPACVESVLGQEGVDVRALIIDDASQDDTAEIGMEIARRDPRVTFVRHPTNRGHIATYNEGIEWLSAEYWLLISADDLLIPGALLRATSLMDRHPRVGLVYGRALLLYDDGKVPPAAPDADEWRLMSGAQFLEYVCETATNPVPTPTVVVRTAIQKEIGGYRPDLPHSGDLEMWMRIAVHADIGALKACQAIKRRHENNMQLIYQGSALGDLSQLSLAFEVLFAGYSSKVRNPEQLHGAARRQMAENAFWIGSQAFDRGDMASFSACMDFAKTCSPAITASDPWRRLRFKTFVGPRIWSWLRPLHGRVRQKIRSSAAHAERVEIMGEWPESDAGVVPL